MRNASNHFFHSRSALRLRLEIALASVLALFILLAHTPLAPPPGPATLTAPPRPQEVIVMEDVVRTVQPRLRVPLPAMTLAEVVEVPDETVVGPTVPLFDATLDAGAALPDSLVGAVVRPPPPAPPPPKAAPVADDEDEVFVVVEQMPEIEGGIPRLYGLLEYPDMARRAGVDGRVIVEIVITRDGRPSDPRVVRSASPLLDGAAVEAVMKLTFKPGRQRGKAVRVRYTLPITFRLDS